MNVMLMRLPLPQVTLCAVDTRAPALAAQALRHSMTQTDFARVILFTNDWLPRRVLSGIELIDIGNIESGAEYSEFILRRLPAFIRSSHVLIAQWDGFVVDPTAWTDEFLVHDYVGAVWPDQPTGRNVGNGGFSLRSRRMMAAGMDIRITQLHPEDEALCRTHRAMLERDHGVSFAPESLARRFSFENESPRAPAFGFHGAYHLPRVFPAATLDLWLDALPDDFFRGRDARRLARAMLARGMTGAARKVLRRREAAGLSDAKTRVLGAAAAVMGLFQSGTRA